MILQHLTPLWSHWAKKGKATQNALGGGLPKILKQYKRILTFFSFFFLKSMKCLRPRRVGFTWTLYICQYIEEMSAGSSGVNSAADIRGQYVLREKHQAYGRAGNSLQIK